MNSTCITNHPQRLIYFSKMCRFLDEVVAAQSIGLMAKKKKIKNVSWWWQFSWRREGVRRECWLVYLCLWFNVNQFHTLYTCKNGAVTILYLRLIIAPPADGILTTERVSVLVSSASQNSDSFGWRWILIISRVATGRSHHSGTN